MCNLIKLLRLSWLLVAGYSKRHATPLEDRHNQPILKTIYLDHPFTARVIIPLRSLEGWIESIQC